MLAAHGTSLDLFGLNSEPTLFSSIVMPMDSADPAMVQTPPPLDIPIHVKQQLFQGEREDLIELSLKVILFLMTGYRCPLFVS